MHFFSPVPVMPLIELIRGRDTDDATETAIRDLGERLGKQVIVSADRPGFIVNRILMPFLAESMRAYEEGLGTAEDIDTGARIGLNHPMGPLELADFIGLDVCLGVMRVLDDGLGGDRFRPPKVLMELVEAGHLGQKTGQGFHTYPREPSQDVTGPLTDEERLLQATAREFADARACPDRHRARRGGTLRPRALRQDGRAGADGGAAPRGRRRHGLLLPRLDAGDGGARARPTCRWRSRCRSTSCRSTRS